MSQRISSRWATALLPTTALLMAGMALVGCSNDQVPSSPTAITPLEGSVDGPVIASSLTAVSPSDDALVHGTVLIDGSCLRLDGANDAVAWPAGTTWDVDANAVALTDGRLVHVGDSVTTGGGHYKIDDQHQYLGSIVVTAVRKCGFEAVILLNGDATRIEISRP